ncbi:MAG: ion channel [Parahaliea sp.]
MIATFIVNSLVVMLVVGFHYECLLQLSRLLPRLRLQPRLKLVLGAGGALIAHAVEIWIFACTYHLALWYLDWGSLTMSGTSTRDMMDCAYYSFTVYTTLGFGDITPQGHIRYLTGIESLTGLVLITWTASFLYLEMEKYWKLEGK